MRRWLNQFLRSVCCALLCEVASRWGETADTCTVQRRALGMLHYYGYRVCMTATYKVFDPQILIPPASVKSSLVYHNQVTHCIDPVRRRIKLDAPSLQYLLIATDRW